MSFKVKILGIAAALASVHTSLNAAREWQVRHIYGADEYLSSTILSDQSLYNRLSYSTTREALARCIVTQTSTWFTLIPASKQSIIYDNCLSFAKSAVSGTARHSEGNLLLAEAAILMEDEKNALSHLKSSRVPAPIDRFNVEWRLILTDRLLKISPKTDVQGVCLSDLSVLMKHLPNSTTLESLQAAKSPIYKTCL